MSDLFQIMKGEIEATGPITVARYMDLALAHPDHGYYKKKDPLGADGDFTTAPEISQMFGEMVGLWAAVVWQAMGQPDPLNLVELGPGRGTLMADALRAAHAMADFDDAVRLWLVETSPALRAKQKQALVPTMMMPAWRDRFADVGPGPMVLIANEFFDALPIHQYQRTEQGWYERCVGLADDANTLEFVLSDAPVDDVLIPEDLRTATPPGGVFEHQPDGAAVMHQIAARVVEHGGAALIFDYGHVGHGIGETLQAVKDHNFVDVLDSPGDADLTAHVDFAQLIASARSAGAEVFGPVPQGAFLERLGLRQRADMLMMNASDAQMQEIDAAYDRLTHADQMGTLFKAVAVVPKGFGVPPWVG